VEVIVPLGEVPFRRLERKKTVIEFDEDFLFAAGVLFGGACIVKEHLYDHLGIALVTIDDTKMVISTYSNTRCT
jgi:hypothetical protein